jgi:hypothetical protein
VSVSTAVAAALGRIVIYGADASGWPDALLHVTGDLDFSTTGGKEQAASLSFTAGQLYWFGVWHSSTATLRTVASSHYGLANSNASNGYTVIRKTGVTFANPAPDPFGFLASQRTTTAAPSVRFRVLSLT